MEDALVCVTRFPKFPTKWFAGVFDGHCGADESDTLDAASVRRVCVEFDREHVERQLSNSVSEERPGSTAVFAIIEKVEGKDEFKILSCNVGDSRIILLRPETGAFFPLTDDHKPTNPAERERIIAAGGFVHQARVNASLALSRAFGDSIYKNEGSVTFEQQKVIAVPDFQEFNALPHDLLLIACDGIFEVTSNDAVANHILSKKGMETPLTEIMQSLINMCICDGSGDNMSAQIIEFQPIEVPLKTNEWYLPGVFWSKGPSPFQTSFYREARHMGLDPFLLRERKTSTVDNPKSEQASFLMHQLANWENTRIALPPRSDLGAPVVLPREPIEPAASGSQVPPLEVFLAKRGGTYMSSQAAMGLSNAGGGSGGAAVAGARGLPSVLGGGMLGGIGGSNSFLPFLSGAHLGVGGRGVLGVEEVLHLDESDSDDDDDIGAHSIALDPTSADVTGLDSDDACEDADETEESREEGVVEGGVGMGLGLVDDNDGAGLHPEGGDVQPSSAGGSLVGGSSRSVGLDEGLTKSKSTLSTVDDEDDDDDGEAFSRKRITDNFDE